MEAIPKVFASSGSVKRAITDFFSLVLEATSEIRVFKFNFAYFEQYGLDGFEALHECLVMAKSLGKFLIADVKRGDIALSNEATFKALHQVWRVDAATFHPYLGLDSFEPLTAYPLRPYFLAKTSNPSSSDLQTLTLEKLPLFAHVLGYYLKQFPKAGFVLGGTDTYSFQESMAVFRRLGLYPYLLIPGFGRQGASLSAILDILSSYYSNEQMAQKVLATISSGIIYAASPMETRMSAVRKAVRESARQYLAELTL
jgi:orotidine-5'-phosphate decarboxylase